jgi:hypothetical protein
MTSAHAQLTTCNADMCLPGCLHSSKADGDVVMTIDMDNPNNRINYTWCKELSSNYMIINVLNVGTEPFVVNVCSVVVLWVNHVKQKMDKQMTVSNLNRKSIVCGCAD